MKKIEVVLNGLNSPDVGYTRVSPKELLEIPDASVDDLMLQDILDYVDKPNEVLSIAVNKLRYGGNITITGMDISEVIRAYTTGGLNFEDMIEMLYRGRKQTTSATELVKKLSSRGLSKVTVRANFYKYAIIMQRPHFVTGLQTTNVM